MNENIFGGNDILKYPYKQLSKFAIEFYTPSAVTFKNKNFYYEMPLNVQDSIYWNGLLKKNEEVQLPISMSGTKIHIIIVCNQKFLEYTNIKLSKDGNIIEESNFLNIYINTKMINDIDSLTIKNLSPSNSVYDILLFSVSDVNLP